MQAVSACLAAFPVAREFLIMRGDDRIGAACDQRGHVEGGPDRRSAAGDCLAAPQTPLSRLMGATPTRLAILRRSRRPSSGSSAMRVRNVALPTPGTLAKRSASACQAGLLRIAPSMSRSSSESSACRRSTCRSMALRTRGWPARATAVFFRDDHLDDLPTARHQFSQRLGFGVRDGPRGRAYGFGEVSDRGGVEAIGLGELAGRTGEIADLTRIDHRQRQMRRGERACDHGLVSARRLERDQRRGKRAQALDKAAPGLRRRA